MVTITIELNEERVKRLKEMALKYGLSIEDLARVGVEEILAQPDEQFQKIMKYVLKKNKDLYKRLAA